MATSLEDTGGRILKLASNGNYLLVEGITVPTDASTGYATGCVFIHTDGGSATAVYINVGSATSSNFDPAGTVPLNVSSMGSDTTIFFVPPDTTALTGFNLAGRISVHMMRADGAGTTLRYIPLYYGS